MKMAATTSGTMDEASTLAAMTASTDRPLHALGFEYHHVSPEKITGCLTVSESWCQPFKRMHGGVAAFVAEGVSSAGAYIASGFQRIAGVQLSINYIKPAFLGDHVEVEATRIQLGRTIQEEDLVNLILILHHQIRILMVLQYLESIDRRKGGK